MECPKCRFVNREGINFCEECGTKLEIECPSCNVKIPLTAKFCGGCGHRIDIPSAPIPQNPSFDEKLDKIQRYLPKGLTEKILSQRNKIEGERKHVTIMFCDMEGFTPLVEKLGPEDAYAIMDQVYEILIHKVHDFEGTVNEMTGDGILGLFGAPIALEDAPQRAIRSSLSIHREMSKFNDSIKQGKNIPSLKMRIGIHSGPVVVGALGNDLRVEFKAVGDTVNLASRIENITEPGTTFVSEDTFKLAKGLFRFEALGEKEIKGKEKPIKLFRVISASNTRTRFDVSAETGLTPFLGREKELEILLDGFERAKSGQGQAFSVISEAGIGKSRLLYEFKKAVSTDDITLFEGKCLSYSKSITYHPLIDILKSAFNVYENDVEDKIVEKIKKGINLLKVDEATTLPFLLELLAVTGRENDIEAMSPDSKKFRIMEAMKQIIVKGSELRPLIIAIEDLHWIDKSSQDFLKDLLSIISGLKIFLILTYRPMFVPVWGGRSHLNFLNLNRLSNRESLKIVCHILNVKEINRNLQEVVLKKTEGIPFFIEEFVKSLIDLAIIEKKNNTYHLTKGSEIHPIPATIQEIIMARVDTLPEGAKNILQIGSVIEREFSYELIRMAIDSTEKELQTQLLVLRDSELLFEKGIHPNATYIYKHALTRDVIYDSILTKKKKKLHEMIGNLIEQLHENKITEYYEILADHFSKSENHIKAAKFFKLASIKAEKAGALTDAIGCMRNGIISLEKLQISEDMQKKIVRSRTVLGMYLFQMFSFTDAKAAIDPIFEKALSIGDKKTVAQIYTIIGAFSFYVGDDTTQAITYLELALQLAQESTDIVSIFFSNQFLGIVRAFNCEFDKAIKNINVALDINLLRNTAWGISISKSTLSYWGFNFHGKIDLGYQTSAEALKLAEKSGDIYSMSGALFSHGFSCFCRGYLNKAEKLLRNAVKYCRRINLVTWEVNCHLYLSAIYIEAEDYSTAKRHCIIVHEFSDWTDIQASIINLNKMQLALLKVKNNKKDIDLESLNSLLIKNNLKVQEGWMRRLIGQILMHTDNGNLVDAEKWIKSAINADEQTGSKWNLGMDYALYAKLLINKGDQLKAIERLEMAIEIFNNCGADGWVKKFKKILQNSDLPGFINH